MQPGAELDKLAAEAMGLPDIFMDYSTSIEAAMEAWAWLEENNPWKPHYLALMRYDKKPSVCLVYYQIDELVTGDSYSHAIALAVVEAGKTLGVIDSQHKL